MFPFNRLFSETIPVRYTFSNTINWQILVNDVVRAKSGRENNSGEFNLDDNDVSVVKVNGRFSAAYGVARVDVENQRKQEFNTAKQRTIPATTRTEQYQHTTGYTLTMDSIERYGRRVPFTVTWKEDVRYKNMVNLNVGDRARFDYGGAIRLFELTGKTAITETRTRTITVPEKRENYYEAKDFSFVFNAVGTEPEPKPTDTDTEPELTPLRSSLVISQKYRVIDPLVYGYVQGKKVPSVRYWRIRNLTPSEVSSLIARGYEVSVVDQETPLTPPTVYASSIIERSKILHPDISHAAQTQRPTYKMSWIEKVGDIGRRRHAGRRSVGQTNLIPAARHVRSSSSRRSMR